MHHMKYFVLHPKNHCFYIEKEAWTQWLVKRRREMIQCKTERDEVRTKKLEVVAVDLE